MKQNIVDRFMKFVKKNEETGCWIWSGGKDKYGYGLFKIDKKRILAHRVAYRLFRGDIPDKLLVCHGPCNNPACVNPEHLYCGTQFDNMRDAVERGTLRAIPPRRIAKPKPERTIIAKEIKIKIVKEKVVQIKAPKEKKDYPIVTKPKSRAGENHNRARLTWAKVGRIRELYNSKQRDQVELGKMFGVDKSQICLIVHNKRWVIKEAS